MNTMFKKLIDAVAMFLGMLIIGHVFLIAGYSLVNGLMWIYGFPMFSMFPFKVLSLLWTVFSIIAIVGMVAEGEVPELDIVDDITHMLKKRSNQRHTYTHAEKDMEK